MSQQNLKARRSRGSIIFLCPGCGRVHVLRVDGNADPKWTFNEDYENPTFTPSILTHGKKITEDGNFTKDAEGNPIDVTCHSYVTDGNIQFLADTTHELAGQTVALPVLTGRLLYD